MGDTPFIKFYPSDFLGGTSGLSPAERGVYITLLCLMYEVDGPVLRDDARLSRRCGAPKTAFKRILDALVLEGKIIEDGGFLTNARAEKSIADRAKRTQNATHAANAKWSAEKKKIQQKQGPDDAGAMPPQCGEDASQKPEPDPDMKEDTGVSSKSAGNEPPPEAPPSPPAPAHANEHSEAVAIYNEAAERIGWPRVQKLTPARTKVLKARLKEAGGIEGWRYAMERAEASDFLNGGSGKWQGFSFDWISKQGNFTKLMEGNYDNKPEQPDSASPDPRAIGRAERMRRIIEAAARGSTG